MAEAWCRHLTRQDTVGCVCIVGGTHGNETNGVYLSRNFAKLQGPAGAAHGYGFELMVLESNPEASKANQRYIEEDLNRCFMSTDLDDPAQVKTYERRRAKEINKLLGPKTSPTPKCDYVLDLHNTTANTGVALFVHPRDKFSHELAAYLVSQDPLVNVALWANRDVVLLPSIGRSGMTFEVGAVATGCLHAEKYNQSKRLVEAALRYMEAHNDAQKRLADGDEAARKPATLQCVQLIRPVPFPRDADKELTGMIHPSVDGHDFSPLKGADPVFSMFDGSERCLQDVTEVSEEAVYPFLVNETSYYEKDVAFMIGRRVEFEVEVLDI